MTSAPASLKTLRTLAKFRPTRDEIEEIVSKATREYDDRSVVLTMASLLDGALEAAILFHLSPAIQNNPMEIFGVDAPLSTFSSKIRMGFAMGLYGPGTKDDLNCIREIRNAYAHSVHAISFDTTEVCAVCDRLKYMDQFGEEAKSLSHMGSREKFDIVAAFLILVLYDLANPEMDKNDPVFEQLTF